MPRAGNQQGKDMTVTISLNKAAFREDKTSEPTLWCLRRGNHGNKLPKCAWLKRALRGLSCMKGEQTLGMDVI